MNTRRFFLLGAVAALLLAPCYSQAQVQVFSEDPVPGATGLFFFNAFMQIDSVSPLNLHTGEDIGISEGEPVYPPIESGSICQVIAVGADYVVLLGSPRQNGDYALCQLVHLYPNTGLTVGSWIGPETRAGDINADATLHFEILLSPDAEISDADLRSPRRHSLCNVAWNADTTPPEITQDPVVHTAPVGSPSVWQIWAADPVGEIYNGIGGMELLIDDVVVDEFDFDAMASKTGEYPPAATEFYYDTTPPAGNNNPNTLQYTLSWVAMDDLEHVWRLRWWDAMGNAAEGDPEHPPVVPLLAGEIGGDLWFEDGEMRAAIRWRVSSLGDMGSFDVRRAVDSEGPYWQANTEPIFAVGGQLDYEFIDVLPEGWTAVWYRLAAHDTYGNTYQMGQAHLGTAVPAAATISSYPNPSSDGFSFQVDTPGKGSGTLVVYNALGQRVRTLHDGALQPGTTMWSWNGRNGRGEHVAQGIYFVRLETPEELVVQKLAVVR
ncbi:T9SS type A sorting domain-containing protein [bacterium]|nr:T9SS type A sorting domain-containing protein [bacterium]